MSKYDFWDELGRIFNAVVAYQEKTVEFNDRFITPWIKMGNVFDKQDRNREAVSAYQNAIALDPSNANNWYELGNLYFQMGDFESASDAYIKSTELSPDSGWAYSNLALTLVSQGKYEESIPVFQKGIELLQIDKDKAVAWNRLGNAYRKLNNYELAMNAFTQADKFDAENAGFRDVLDDISDGPSIMQSVDAEGQEGSVVQEPIQPDLENDPELDAVVPVVESEPELIAESQINIDQVVSEESAVSESTPESEPVLETDSQITSETTLEEVSESELQIDLVTGVESTSLEVLETKTVQEMEAEVPVADLESENEVVSDLVDEIKTETVEEVAQPESPAPRSILEIVEAVIAKVLAESPAEDESPAPVIEEQTTSDETVLEERENVMSDSTANLALEPLDQPLEIVQPELDLDPAQTAVEAMAQDEALELIAQNTSETFTDTLFVANTETDTSDASLLTPENVVESNPEPQVEAASQELPVDVQAAPVNVAYEEYLNDSHGQFKISVNELGTETATAQESFLPAALMAKIDFSGDTPIEADAKNAHVWNELGNVYFNSGAFEDAITAYSKSIDLDRQFAWPYSNLALVYVQKGRFAEAMLLYQRSIELFSNDKDKAVSWNRLGNVYRRVSDYDNAIAAYQRADELDTDNTTLSLQSRFSLLGNYYMEPKTSYAS